MPKFINNMETRLKIVLSDGGHFTYNHLNMFGIAKELVRKLNSELREFQETAFLTRFTITLNNVETNFEYGANRYQVLKSLIKYVEDFVSNFPSENTNTLFSELVQRLHHIANFYDVSNQSKKDV